MICRLFTFLLSGTVCSCLLSASELKIGDTIPNVSALDSSGVDVELSSFSTEAWVLVYFYPKADTPGCTKQACSLRDAYEKLTQSGVKVIGVSADSLSDQKAFAEKYQLPFTLIADADKKVIKAFGVSQMPVVGFAKRQAYLFKEGKLVWKDLKASTAKQAADVIKVISNHS